MQKTRSTEPDQYADFQQETVESDAMPAAGMLPLEVLAGPYEQLEECGNRRKQQGSKQSDQDDMTGGNFNTFGE